MGTTKTVSRIAFALLALGCGGRAVDQVSTSPGGGEAAGGASSRAVAGASAGGAPSIDIGNVAGASAGGAPSTGGAPPMVMGDAGAGELGGAVGVAGAAAVYCGVMVSAPTQPVAFVPTELVWSRIQGFLGTAQPMPVALPVNSSRALAGELLDKTLDSLNGAPAPGLARFVSGWWPGTPNADAWAALFGDSKATLTDLLTTTSVANPGSGILTDPAVLKLPDITPRGEFIHEHLLCNSPLPPSPPGIPPLGPVQPGQTRRQRLEQGLRVAPSCAACHAQADPYGDSLEHYDTAGMFNELDNGSPIDSSGTALAPAAGASGLLVFSDVNELGKELAAQCGVSWCLTQALLADAETTAKLPVPGDPPAIAQIANASQTGRLRDLLRSIVESDTFLRAR